MSRCFLSVIVALVMCVAANAAAPQYNRDIRPILAEYCFACHGPDSASRKGELRLDLREAAVEKKAIVPGHPEESELLTRLHATDPDEIMPPPKTKKTVSAAHKELLKQWIAAGANYELHWSLLPPQKVTPPPVKNVTWARNPIDQFILAKLEERGLAPAPEADRRTLARRLSLDLVGLPPTPEKVEAFANDTSPEYYERYVDALLQSQHWGEHRGRYWLDAARYADTHGIHIDNYREIWAYRDWVINAFNRNQPFDQFTTEQLAGDLLPNRTTEQQIATGFHRCNITTSEGGAINEEYLVLYARDRTETTSTVWLGLTLNCCVCHDHKFDPLTTKEFYSFSAFFNNTTQPAMDGNKKDTPPVISVARAEDRARDEALALSIAEAQKTRDARMLAAQAEHDQWLASAKPQAVAAQASSAGLQFHLPLSEGAGDKLVGALNGKPKELNVANSAWTTDPAGGNAWQVQPGAVALGEAGDFDHNQAFSCGVWVKVNGKTPNGALIARMDDGNDFRGWDLWYQNGSVGTHLIHKWPSDAIKVVTKQPIKKNEWTHVLISHDGSSTLAGANVYVNGELQEVTVEASSLKSTTRTTVPLKLGMRHKTSPLADIAMHDVRIYNRSLAAGEVAQLAKSTRVGALLAKAAGERSAAERQELFTWWLGAHDTAYQEVQRKIAALETEKRQLKTKGAITHVMQEKDEAAMAYLLHRGEYDQRRDKVTPETPAKLPPFPAGAPRNRLGLAQWLLQPEHPLTTRVTANRFWQEVFGTGLVRTTGDFGITGELPSHPELLDWLAVDFREHQWDIKRFFKQLVMSAAYRQSAAVTPEKLERDLANRLLSRGARFRMDAEMVRDYALASSGLLVPKIGGPSVKPYQPDGVWEAVAMPNSDTRNYKRDTGENLYRRSLYTFWKRTAPPAALETLNAPNRETCVVRRERTNTPLQALVTMNDPQFVEAARHLAQTTLKLGGDTPEKRLDFLARRVLSRPWRETELPLVQAVLTDLLAHYAENPKDAQQLLAVGESKPDASLNPSEHAAWTMLANELLNRDEVLCK